MNWWSDMMEVAEGLWRVFFKGDLDGYAQMYVYVPGWYGNFMDCLHEGGWETCRYVFGQWSEDGCLFELVGVCP